MRRFLSLLLCFLGCVEFYTCCCRAKPKGDTNCGIVYNLIKSDAKSNKSVITRRRVGSLGKCRDIAETKRALAFNFDRAMTTSNLDLDNGWRETANCVLLHCPETQGLSQLVNVTGIDYYSAYPDVEYKGNDSLFCVEKIGLFNLVFDRANFTNARENCRKMNNFPGRATGILADPIDEARTNGLASLIGKFTVYVGLSNEGSQRNWKNELGDTLSCSDYRAWAAGEPSHSRGCVALFRAEPKADPVWKVMNCATELSYICEIPYLPVLRIN